MPTAAEVKALAFDPVDRWAAVPDAVITKLIAVVGRFYADLVGAAECEDLIAYHVAHMLALSGVGVAALQPGPVASASVSLGGASKTYAVQAIPVGVKIDPLDGRTPYGAIALALRDSIPTCATGTT